MAQETPQMHDRVKAELEQFEKLTPSQRLGLPTGASITEIRAARKKLAIAFHAVDPMQKNQLIQGKLALINAAADHLMGRSVARRDADFQSSSSWERADGTRGSGEAGKPSAEFTRLYNAFFRAPYTFESLEREIRKSPIEKIRSLDLQVQSIERTKLPSAEKNNLLDLLCARLDNEILQKTISLSIPEILTFFKNEIFSHKLPAAAAPYVYRIAHRHVNIKVIDVFFDRRYRFTEVLELVDQIDEFAPILPETEFNKLREKLDGYLRHYRDNVKSKLEDALQWMNSDTELIDMENACRAHKLPPDLEKECVDIIATRTQDLRTAKI